MDFQYEEGRRMDLYCVLCNLGLVANSVIPYHVTRLVSCIVLHLLHLDS